MVDDNPADRLLYRIALENNPFRTYEIIEAGSGHAGLELCAREKPDCMLLDFVLPDITGLEFLTELKNASAGGALPCAVVMLTGVADQRVAVEAMKEGATDYITKSVGVSEVLDRVIGAAVDKFRLRHEIAQSHIELAAREQQYRTLLEAIPQLVWSANCNGKLEHANSRWVDYTGIAPGSQLNWETLLHPEDCQNFQKLWSDAVERGTAFEAEHRLRRASDSTYRWHLARAVPIKTGDGPDVTWFATSTDIHNQKEAEKTLQQRQTWESVGLLAGGIAHDFNNLLVGILGGASYVQDILPSGHAAQSILSTVVNSSQKAALLTRQMLAYAGKGRFVIEPVSLTTMLPETYEMIRSSVPENVEVTMELEDNLPPVQTDSAQMQQVIMNLVINAVESIPDEQPGHVFVRTFATPEAPAEADTSLLNHTETLKARSTDVVTDARYGYVVLEVRDDGRGMDTETLAKIFDPFFTTKFTGRGLGLAAVDGIVRSSGGRITVASRPHDGSMFRIYLPAGAPKAKLDTPDQKRKANWDTGRSSISVLIIDDEEMVIKVAATALERAGVQVFAAETGEKALETLREQGERLSVVLLDLSMPGMGGKEVLRRMKQEGINTPVVVLSGYSEYEVSRQLDSFEIAGFLPKPFAVAKLVQTVTSLADSQRGTVLSAGNTAN